MTIADYCMFEFNWFNLFLFIFRILYQQSKYMLLKANGYHDVFGDRSAVLVPDFNFEKKELMASNFYPEYCDLVIRSSKLEIIKIYHTANIYHQNLQLF